MQIGGRCFTGLERRAAFDGEERRFIVHVAGRRIGDERSVLYARQRSRTAKDLLIEISDLHVVRVDFLRQGNLSTQNTGRFESLIGTREPHKSLNGLARAHQQDQRNHDLRDHQCGAQLCAVRRASVNNMRASRPALVSRNRPASKAPRLHFRVNDWVWAGTRSRCGQDSSRAVSSWLGPIIDHL